LAQILTAVDLLLVQNKFEPDVQFNLLFLLQRQLNLHQFGVVPVHVNFVGLVEEEFVHQLLSLAGEDVGVLLLLQDVVFPRIVVSRHVEWVLEQHEEY